MSRKRTSIIWTIKKEKLEEIVSKFDSLSDILHYFGIAKNSRTYEMLKKRMNEDGVNYDHIPLGLGCNKGRSFFDKKGYALEQVAIENSTYGSGHLKNRLLEKGILKNECSLCSMKDMWNGKPITMIMDHINGIRNDHRLENLRMVCPNCNSQLDTTNGRNRRKISNCKVCGKQVHKKDLYCAQCEKDGPKIRIGKASRSKDVVCPSCGGEKYPSSQICNACASIVNGLRQRRVERPSKDELEVLIQKHPMTFLGKKFGVSDNAVKKWCVGYGIALENRHQQSALIRMNQVQTV